MPLVTEDGELTRDDHEMAELLASYFKEAFTIHDTTTYSAGERSEMG